MSQQLDRDELMEIVFSTKCVCILGDVSYTAWLYLLFSSMAAAPNDPTCDFQIMTLREWFAVNAIWMTIHCILSCLHLSPRYASCCSQMQWYNQVLNITYAFELVWHSVGIYGWRAIHTACTPHATVDQFLVMCIVHLFITSLSVVLHCVTQCRQNNLLDVIRTLCRSPESTISPIPIHLVFRTLVELPEDHNCSICLEPMSLSNACGLYSCSHVFHRSCILKWIESNPPGMCVLCRSPIHHDTQQIKSETIMMPREIIVVI